MSEELDPAANGSHDETSSPLLGIFADDLTGALDAAAPFANLGFRTLVSPGHKLPKGANNAEVVSVNLGTRHQEPTEIAAYSASAVTALSKLGVKVLLNKVDSTLRGNPGVELIAAMEVLSADRSVLCPAYPQNNRTVENGLLLVNGVPVAETDVGQDQLSPLSSSRIEEIMRESLTRAGLENKVEIQNHRAGDDGAAGRPTLMLPDARSQEDLRILAGRVAQATPPALIAGSAGLSAALAEAMNAKLARPVPRSTRTVSRILIVTASQRAVVDEQLSVLGDQVDLAMAEVPASEAVNGIGAASVARLSSLATKYDVTVVRLGKLEAGGHEPLELRAIAESIVNNLGQAVQEIADVAQPDAIVIIGGDTARGVLDACGVSSIMLRGELQPGTVSGTPVDGSIEGALLVTRAGDFGDQNSLFELVSLLKYGLRPEQKRDENL